ncbi:MAG: tetratricopeptide repeat protein [Candidatus Promineifilaceae bacterium]|nr:tetratricopeptide repeat protein [Candidatus Promineifilaceae bacterium]
MKLHIYLFGGFRLQTQDTPLPTIRSRVARSLFAYLVTYRERPHTRRLLAGLFWPDETEARARRRLSQALWEIRTVLRQLDSPHAHLLADKETLQFNSQAPYWLDVEAFQERIQQADVEPSPPSLALLEEAIDLYAGDFLAGYYDDWAIVEREKQRDRFLETLQSAVRVGKAQGLHEKALAFALRLTRADPLREEGHREAMRLYVLLDRPEEALQQYERCRQALDEELGVDPSPATRTLYEETRARLKQSRPTQPAPSPASPPFLQESVPLTGRERERSALVRALEHTLAGRGSVLLIEGEAGVGKTRLLQQLAEDAAWRGVHVLEGAGRQQETLAPYSALGRALGAGLSPLRAAQLDALVESVWLAALSQIAPRLKEWLPDLPSPASLRPADEQQRLLEGTIRVFLALGEIAPHLLILDDAHWADESTLEALAGLAPRLADHPFLLAVSYRSGQARARPVLWDVVRRLDQSERRRRLVLSRLDEAETAQLVRRWLGRVEVGPHFESYLFHETGGNPLFVLETLRALQDQGRLTQDAAGVWRAPEEGAVDRRSALPLSNRLQQAIAGRLERLEPAAREVLEAAAVLGDEFDHQLLQQTSPTADVIALNALDTLLRRGLLVEEGDDASGYTFIHDLVRQVAYERMAPEKRSVLHRRAGHALEAARPGQVQALARHFSRGEVWHKAVTYHYRAAGKAARVYAIQTALDACERVLHILDEHEPLPPRRADELRYDTLEKAHDLLWMQGQKESAEENVEQMVRLARTLEDPERLTRSLTRRAHLYYSLDRYDEAIEQAEAALSLARQHAFHRQAALALTYLGDAAYQSDRYEQATEALQQALAIWDEVDVPSVDVSSSDKTSNKVAGIHARLNQVYRKQGKLDRAEAALEEARAIAESLDDHFWLTIVFIEMAHNASIRGDYETSIARNEQALDLARSIGFTRNRPVILGNLGLDYMALGDYGRALETTQESLTLYRQTGKTRGIVTCLVDLGELYTITGRYEDAEAVLEEALSLAQEIGYAFIEAFALGLLGRVHVRRESPAAGRDVLREGQRVAMEIQAPTVEGIVHASWGLLRLEEDDPAGAAHSFQQACNAFETAGEATRLTKAHSYLALACLAQDRLDEARQLSQETVSALTGGNGGEVAPIVYYHRSRILNAAGEPEQARAALEKAHGIVREQQATLPDAAWRETFVDDVPIHRAIVRSWQAQQPETVTVSLPHEDAPTGRPLREDEWVDVAWTVEAAEDDAVQGKKARRQHRIRRLLREAAARQASPRVKDLAAALGVSRRTIKRDLAGLRREGYDVETRGSR